MQIFETDKITQKQKYLSINEVMNRCGHIGISIQWGIQLQK